MLRRAILMATLAGLGLAACSSEDPGGGAAPVGEEAPVDPIVAEGNGLGSCAFDFSVQTLGEREFAFEGTVTEIREPESTDAPYEVAFEVARWFHGGDAAATTVRTYDVSGTSLAGDMALTVGDHVLASGDDHFLWGCGFSMAYSDEDAAIFQEAFPA